MVINSLQFPKIPTTCFGSHSNTVVVDVIRVDGASSTGIINYVDYDNSMQNEIQIVRPCDVILTNCSLFQFHSVHR